MPLPTQVKRKMIDDGSKAERNLLLEIYECLIKQSIEHTYDKRTISEKYTGERRCKQLEEEKRKAKK